MSEKPIIFSAPMVRAILAGTKTQTRRIFKSSTEFKGPYNPAYLQAHKSASGWKGICPYGKIGDRLWVRETFAIHSVDPGTVSIGFKERMPSGKTLAQTDGGLNVVNLEPKDWDKAYLMVDGERWRSPIHMPRWASRITLEITDIRVQRVQDISEADAKAEGARSADYATGREAILDPSAGSYRLHFQSLWDFIVPNKKPENFWHNNPWVWALSFWRVEK